ncbi:MAG: PAC2 family protein [Candidatus Omnitrophica bacterium]|nr:PAC2 family protein [Candidatus Omnitrophota bacterium]
MIKILSTLKLNSPLMICAWPGMGEVALKAALNLKEILQFKEFAKLESPEYFEPSSVSIKNGVLELPSHIGGTFYCYKNPKRTNDIILFISDMQPNMGSTITYATEIIKFAENQKVKMIYSFAAMSVPIDHAQDPKVWIAMTSRKLLQNFKGLNLKILNEGQVSGLNGLILGIAKSRGIDGVCLLGEIPIYTIQIENPKASLAVLEALEKNLRLGINLVPLRERARFVEEEINKLIGYIKGETLPVGPLSEEDIEKIKKELSAFTKLPESARKKIEDLFKLAAEDLTRSTELKKELDTWSVFKDYEDRFLDLFRKKKSGQ